MATRDCGAAEIFAVSGIAGDLGRAFARKTNERIMDGRFRTRTRIDGSASADGDSGRLKAALLVSELANCGHYRVIVIRDISIFHPSRCNSDHSNGGRTASGTLFLNPLYSAPIQHK